MTLTDHDTIAGGLALIDRHDFFLSEEITTRFPENGCVMHVLAWDIARTVRALRDRLTAVGYRDYVRARNIAAQSIPSSA